MSLLPYKYFLYIGLLVSASLVVAPWVVSLDTTTPNIAIGLIGVLLAAGIFSDKSKNLSLSFNLLTTRLTILVYFVLAVVLNFLPYMLKFSNTLPLVAICFASAAVLLLDIFFGKFTNLE